MGRLPAPLESPQKRNKLWGFGRGHRRSWKMKEVLVKQEDSDEVVKKEDDNADDLDLHLSNIDDIINGRA